MRRHRLLLAALVVATAAALTAASPAAAVPCEGQVLTDALGRQWSSTDSIQAGTVIDALDFQTPYFDYAYSTYYEADGVLADGCAFEDGNRELRYPPIMVGDLEVSGTMFVPVGPPAFQRTLLLLRNPNAEPAALPPFIYNETSYNTDTLVVTSSSGDGVGTAADDWITLRDGAAFMRPRVGFLWNFGPAGDRRRSAVEVAEFDDLADPPAGPYTGGDAQVAVRFDRHVVPPGATVAYLWVGLVREDDAGSEAAAREVQAAPDALLAGLSDEEKRLLQNVGLPDTDVDGVLNGNDNCRFDVNGDQANLDGDAMGDACDDDVDGDGVGNATETARGTDPRSVDSDGDGRRDADDVCPLKAGGGADGCVRGDDPPPVPDTTKPGATIRSLRATMKLKAFRRGVPCVVDVTEAATVLCRLLVRATRVARVAAAGDLEVAARSLPLAAGRRSVRLKPKRGLIRQRRFRATLQVTVTDAAGNRSTKSRRFRVR